MYDISDFGRLLDTFKALGIDFNINWGPTKAEWQKIILDAGYNLTALACTVVVVGNTEFLFSNGQAIWDKEGNGFGPSGVYLLRRDKATGIVTVSTRKEQACQLYASA